MRYILTFVSADRSGLVAKLSKVLYESGFNITDSSCTRLSGVFAMALMVEHTQKFSTASIKALFPDELSPLVFLPEDAGEAAEGERYTISVYGADKPGIVYTISESLASDAVNIVDLQTAKGDMYVMILEVIPPLNADGGWIRRLEDKAKSFGIDISVRKAEIYEL